MEINSTIFLLFFMVVFLVYYLPLQHHVRAQNLWLLLCSYASFAVVEWQMLPLLIGVTCLFYGLGIWIHQYNRKDERKASWLTTAGVIVGIGVLTYFKYLSFLIDEVTHLLQQLGWQVNPLTIHIIMPIGVSFFTFKLISYIVEVHRCHIQPCRDFVAFATYVAFFPTLLCGPIDRPKPFLSQLETARPFIYPSQDNKVVDGLRQILWGLFKKVVIADSLNAFVELGWNKTEESTPIALLFVVLVYPIQLYADFSGYSDMAIGVSKMLGLNVAKNFNYPFFAQNMADYWRRWHMSLTSWLTDYVFMPLNIKLRDWDKTGIMLACIINMLIVGIWHGANWTFFWFGLYHGILFIPLILNGSFTSKKKVKFEGLVPPVHYMGKMLLTYLFVAVGLLIFRADNMERLGVFVSLMLSNTTVIDAALDAYQFPKMTFVFVLLMFAAEWVAMRKKKEYALQLSIEWKAWIRYTTYMVLIILYLLKVGGSHDFIYAQF